MEQKVQQQFHKKRNLVTGNINDKCLAFDMYGRRVQLTYHGNENFRTNFGAFCTIFIGTIVMAYAIFKSTQLVNPFHALPLQSKVHRSSFYETFESTEGITHRDGSQKSLESVDEPAQIQKFFGFNIGRNELISPDVGSFRVELITKKRNSRPIIEKELPVVPCSESSIGYE